MNLHRLVFVVAMSLCLVTSAATAAEAREHGTPTNEDKEITDIQTDEELRLYLNEVRQLIPPSDCSEWNQDDARVVAVFEFRTNKELWIGKEYDDSDGLGVNGLQRTYEIEDISKGGSPIRGSIKIRLPTTEMDTERVCFTTLQGIHVRGAKNDGEGVYRSDLWNMTIDEVNFGILVEPQGIMKEKTPTGETQVTLTISEGLVTMVLRKSVEHLWALPGSFVLMALSAMGSHILARKRATRSGRFWTLPRSLASTALWTVRVAGRISEITRTWWPLRPVTASKATQSQPRNQMRGSSNSGDQPDGC